MASARMFANMNKDPRYEVRNRNSCNQCGRPRAFYRKFKLCRVCLRKHALQGDLLGVTKSSW